MAVCQCVRGHLVLTRVPPVDFSACSIHCLRSESTKIVKGEEEGERWLCLSFLERKAGKPGARCKLKGFSATSCMLGVSGGYCCTHINSVSSLLRFRLFFFPRSLQPRACCLAAPSLNNTTVCCCALKTRPRGRSVALNTLCDETLHKAVIPSFILLYTHNTINTP